MSYISEWAELQHKQENKGVGVFKAAIKQRDAKIRYKLFIVYF